jgi:hypothetical protein
LSARYELGSPSSSTAPSLARHRPLCPHHATELGTDRHHAASVNRSYLVLAAAALLAAALLAGCGEKEESIVESTPRTTENDVLADIVGSWEGELQQKGLKPFTVEASIRSPKDRRVSRVHYTGIDCSGTWTLERVREMTVYFLESIDRGQGGECKGTGTVQITPAPGEERLAYEFRGGGVESRGTLHRLGS